jgi:hypothetical protein
VDGQGAAVRRVRAGGAPRLLGVLFVALVSWGHVGSPNVFFEGTAGPYPVRVIVRPPAVIPGLAEIAVRTPARGISGVAVQPVVWNAGPEGAPPPDEAKRVPGDPELWSAQLWLMTADSYSVRVRVRGDDREGGEGIAIVPVAAVATRRLPMQRGLGVALAALGAFLVLGGLSIVGAAVREGVLAPGEVPDERRRTRARLAAAASGMLLALALAGGRAWWNQVDAEHRAGLYRPFHVTGEVRRGPEGRVLRLTVDDPRWRNREWTPLVPDHGKLMHLFLVREPGLDAFAHLHPEPRGARSGRGPGLGPGFEDNSFEAPLPALPAGSYRLYADVTHESGFPQTWTTRVRVPAATGLAAVPGDPDDSWRLGAPAAGEVPASPLGGGLTMTWRRGSGPLAAGREAGLRFAVAGPDGRPAALEPYMGMLAHAVVTREDGAVFVHLHPSGSISMASQALFEKRQGTGGMAPMAGMAGMDHAAHAGKPASEVAFPYEFPRPGRYRLWVQVKSGGAVRTGVFSALVEK